MNDENCAAVCMPFWYLDRFTNYMPDLAGQMKIAPMPLWPDGGHKSAQMGGTGTAVVASSPNAEVAKEFLAYACLTFDGCVTTWKICNNLLWPMNILQTEELHTIPIGMGTTITPYGNAYDVLMPGAVMAVVPIIIIYLFAQKTFIKGLTAGSVKG